MLSANPTRLSWILIAAYAVLIALAVAAPGLVSRPAAVGGSAILSAVFALAHGAARYRVRGILILFALCVVVGNSFETVSILTGFPFGRFHYTDLLGPKLFMVPWVIGPSYFAIGYLSWTLATVLLGDRGRRAEPLTVFAVPLIGAFLMAGWDACFDPEYSTVDRLWIWETAGGYFGVPLVNVLGWFLTGYVSLQLFALYLRARRDADRAAALPNTYWYQAVVWYGMTALACPWRYLAGGDRQVTDPSGAVWSTADLHETTAIFSLCTMFFAVALAAIKIAQRKGPA